MHPAHPSCCAKFSYVTNLEKKYHWLLEKITEKWYLLLHLRADMYEITVACYHSLLVFSFFFGIYIVLYIYYGMFQILSQK